MGWPQAILRTSKDRHKAQGEGEVDDFNKAHIPSLPNRNSSHSQQLKLQDTSDVLHIALYFLRIFFSASCCYMLFSSFLLNRFLGDLV
jgi:hypothetical protein